jgi:hypothetical protein
LVSRNEKNRTPFAYSGSWHSPSQSGTGHVASPSGQEDSDFEELPELQASEILKPEFLKGRAHTVQESVPTSSGMNRFTIDSQFGAFEAEGNEMLVRRVGEIDAIARLKDMSRTDVTSRRSPKQPKLRRMRRNALPPIRLPPSKTPQKGIMKFISRAASQSKH